MRETEISDGREFFKGNRIVRTLLDMTKKSRKLDLNDIWDMHSNGLFTREEMEEFYQLISYSVTGYGEIFGEGE